jgi:hypothetical protein
MTSHRAIVGEHPASKEHWKSLPNLKSTISNLKSPKSEIHNPQSLGSDAP